MRVLLDNCVNKKFGKLLVGHEIYHSSGMGWSKLGSGTGGGVMDKL